MPLSISPELIAKYLRREPLDFLQVLQVETALRIEREFSFYPEENKEMFFLTQLAKLRRKIENVERRLH